MKKLGFMAALLGILAMVGFVVLQGLNDRSVGNDAFEEIARDEQDGARSKLLIEDIEVGEGPAAERGDLLSVHYIGRLEDGTEFDNSIEREEPLTFALGSGELIQGFDVGVEGMKTGGVRRIVIPPELAYGEREIPGLIPPNSTLIFDITLVGIQAIE